MTREDILNIAKECVCQSREEDYGAPENNFALIADLWNAYLGFNEIRDIFIVTFRKEFYNLH